VNYHLLFNFFYLSPLRRKELLARMSKPTPNTDFPYLVFIPRIICIIISIPALNFAVAMSRKESCDILDGYYYWHCTSTPIASFVLVRLAPTHQSVPFTQN
jgi:hypothetical protein